MSDGSLIVLIVYPLTAFLFSFIRWIEWDDNNLLRIALIGVGWPMAVLWFAYRASRATGRYLRGRFWVELAEVLPKATRESLPPPQDAADHAYEAGQWKD